MIELAITYGGKPHPEFNNAIAEAIGDHPGNLIIEYGRDGNRGEEKTTLTLQDLEPAYLDSIFDAAGEYGTYGHASIYANPNDLRDDEPGDPSVTLDALADEIGKADEATPAAERVRKIIREHGFNKIAEGDHPDRGIVLLLDDMSGCLLPLSADACRVLELPAGATIADAAPLLRERLVGLGLLNNETVEAAA